jgi:hypothetical protein
MESGNIQTLGGVYEWFVDPELFAQSDIYKIRIRSADESVADDSDGFFSVVEQIPPFLELLNPLGGEVIQQKTIFSINWEYANFMGSENLFVEYSFDGGTEWLVMSTGTVNSLKGQFSWFIDVNEFFFPVRDNYKVRVRTSDGALVSESPGTFEIVDPAEPIITLLSPNGGDKI